MSDLTCQYCNGKAILKDSAIVYGRSYGNLFICENFPTCDTYVGVHRDRDEPLGTLANRELREWRKRSKNLFKPLWQLKTMKRTAAYEWLGQWMQLSKDDVHFGKFSLEQCKQAYQIMNEQLKIKYYAGIGSRETPEEILALMRLFASKMYQKSWRLRSGGAKGADKAFEQSIGDKNYGEIYRADDAKGLENFHEIAEQFHPNWAACDAKGSYVKDLHARNGMIVLGADLISPVKFIVCWTKDGEATGGTGQALRIAEHYGIPVKNLYYGKVQQEILKIVEN